MQARADGPSTTTIIDRKESQTTRTLNSDRAQNPSQQSLTPQELNKFLLSKQTTTSQQQQQRQRQQSLKDSIETVERCLKENRENLREFFSTCYQTLLWQIFNFDESGSGWLQSVSSARDYNNTNSNINSSSNGNRHQQQRDFSTTTTTTNNTNTNNTTNTNNNHKEEVTLLLKFLSPEGPLMRAIYSADSNNLVQFAFPLERLSQKTQRMLQTQQGAIELSRNPLFRGKIKQDPENGRYLVQLGLYHYFLFWNAYFVQRVGNIAGGGHRTTHHIASAAAATQFMHSQRPTLAQTHDQLQTPGGGSGWNPSTKLSSLKTSALQHTTMKANDLSKIESSNQRERGGIRNSRHPYQDLLISHLEYFFKPRQTDDANEKMGGNIVTEGEMIVNVLIEFWLSESDISTGSRYLYNPPDDNLVNAVTLLAIYLGENEYSSPAFIRARERLQRPLYRFLHDAFTLWPIESTRSLEPITNLWVAYITPWIKENVHFLHSPQDSKFMSHLLSNVPFYHYLMKHFLELCCKLVPSDPEGTALILVRVFENLEQSPELITVLNVLEEGFNKYIEDPLKATANRINNQETLTPYDHMFPIIQNQLADWDPPALKTENELGTHRNVSSIAGGLQQQQQQYQQQQTPLRNRSGRLGVNAGLFNSPLSRRKNNMLSTPGGKMPTSFKGGHHQDNQFVLQKLTMFDLGPDGLPQVAVALLVRLSRDLQESSSNSILRKFVPQFRKSAFAVLPLEKSPDVSLLKNSAAQSAKNRKVTDGTSSFEWNKKLKFKSARDLYVGDWMHRPIGETEFGPLVKILVYLSQFLNTSFNFDGVKKVVISNGEEVDVFPQLTKTWNDCSNKKDYWAVCKAVVKIAQIFVLNIIGRALDVLRRRGFRVNLRFMAEYSMMVLLFLGWYSLKLVLRLLFF